MSSFDLFLTHRDEEPSSLKPLLEVLAETPFLRDSPGDPTRFVYYNPDTTVHFHIVLSPALVGESHGAGADEDWQDEEVRRPVNVMAHEEFNASEDDHEDNEYSESEVEDGEAPEFAPLTVSVPCFRPSFFVEEAMALLAKLQQASGLALQDPQEEGAGGGEPGDWSLEEILASWIRTNQKLVPLLTDANRLETWSATRCQAFFSYAGQRPKLLDAFGAEGLDVPQVHPARYDGRVATLCVWRSAAAVVLPKCDVVLLERPREKRGLLGKKTVYDEVLVPGDTIWNLLRPHSELREDPAPMLIYRGGETPPQLARDLAALAGEPGGAAKRCELTAVIDFELPQDDGETT